MSETTKETKLELSVSGWSNHYGTELVYVGLGGVGPAGKLKGLAKYDPIDDTVSVDGKSGRCAAWDRCAAEPRRRESR